MTTATEGVRRSKKSSLDTRGEKKATGQAQRVQKVKAESQEQTIGDQERQQARVRRELEDERVREARLQRVRVQPAGS